MRTHRIRVTFESRDRSTVAITAWPRPDRAIYCGTIHRVADGWEARELQYSSAAGAATALAVATLRSR